MQKFVTHFTNARKITQGFPLYVWFAQICAPFFYKMIFVNPDAGGRQSLFLNYISKQRNQSNKKHINESNKQL